VADDQLRQIYDIMKQGPTSANTCPARILLRDEAARRRLLLDPARGDVPLIIFTAAYLGPEAEADVREAMRR
jgi:hypothetical protein